MFIYFIKVCKYIKFINILIVISNIIIIKCIKYQFINFQLILNISWFRITTLCW